jgi:hypothetical protein
MSEEHLKKGADQTMEGHLASPVCFAMPIFLSGVLQRGPSLEPFQFLGQLYGLKRSLNSHSAHEQVQQC